MNYSIAIFLINRDARAVKVTYEAEVAGKPPMERYTYKTLDPDIHVGDLVVIPTDTRHNMTVCKVVETDVDIDFDSSKEIKWIISKVDTGAHDAVLAKEAQAITAIRSAEVRKKRDDLAAALFKDNPDLVALMPSNGPQALSPPPAP